MTAAAAKTDDNDKLSRPIRPQAARIAEVEGALQYYLREAHARSAASAYVEEQMGLGSLIDENGARAST